MENSIKEVSKTKKEIYVSISFKEFEKFIQNTTDKLVKEVEIKGFRKGQAPRDLAVKNIKQEEILRQAASVAINQIYPEIIRENKLEVIGPPEIEILKLALDNPLEFKATIFIMPEIELPDYRKIIKGVKSSEIIITDEEVEQAFKQLEEMKDKIPQEQKDRIKLEKPEELKRVLKQEIKKEKEVMEKGRVRNDMLKLISEKCELEVPEILVSVEKHRMLEDIKRNISQVLKITFEDYLKQIKKTEKELEDSLTNEITERIKRIMILGKIQKIENIEASQEELEREIKGFLNHPVNAKIKDQIDRKALNAYLKERIEDEKTLQLLEGLIANH